MNKARLLHSSRLYKIFKPFYSGIGHVLMFHRVGDNSKYMFNRDLMVGTGFLEAALNYFISHDIELVSLDECHRRIISGARTKRFAAITFDDGYQDNLTHALPVLEKYNAPFTVFLSTGYPDHTIVLWWYLLEDLVKRSRSIEFEENGHSFFFTTSSEAEKREAFWAIRRYIMNSDQEHLIPVFKNIFKMTAEELYLPVKKMALSWAQVKEMADHPLVSIEAHTVNHYVLSKLKEEEVLAEIMNSIELIKKRTGQAVSHLAYPYGISSAAGLREFELAGRCHLKTAFTTESSNIFRHHSGKLFALPRIEITEGWSDMYFDLYVNGFTPFVHKFIR
jgi:peptidoglycan/xylan/chitin deacetylase (PgdA/CDA1 family)